MLYNIGVYNFLKDATMVVNTSPPLEADPAGLRRTKRDVKKVHTNPTSCVLLNAGAPKKRNNDNCFTELLRFMSGRKQILSRF